MESLSHSHKSPLHSPQGRRKQIEGIKIQNNEEQYVQVAPDLDTRWAELIISGKNIPGRGYHSMALQNGNVIMYGGFDGQQGMYDDFYYMKVSGDVEKYEWKPVSVSSSSQTKPGKRRRHTTIIYENKMYLFGGQINTIYNSNDLFCFDFKERKWTEIKAENPPPNMDSHGALIYQNKMIVICGYLGGDIPCYCNSVYAFDMQEQKWEVLYANNPKDINAPCPRSSMGVTIMNDDIYLMGGCTFDSKFNDLWKFNISSKTWSLIPPKSTVVPEIRNGHCMFEYSGLLYIFGGIQDVTKEKNDIYQFNLQTNEWKCIHHEKPIEFQSPTKKPQRMNKSPPKMSNVGRQSSKFYSSLDPRHPLDSPKKMQTKQQSPNESPQKRDNSSQRIAEMAAIHNYSTQEGQKTFVEQKKSEQQAHLKYLMLKEFLEYQPSEDDKQQPPSPISDAMKKSINMIGDPRNKKEIQKELQQSQQPPNQVNLLNQSKLNETHESFLKAKKHPKQFIQGNNILIGKRPTGRDGAALCLLEGGMFLIYGGDRHLMSFNNLFLFKLEGKFQGVQETQDAFLTQENGEK